MPLKLRTRDGKTVPVPADTALEYTDNNGRLAAVVLQRPDGSLKLATVGDADFNAYSNVFNLPASRVTVHEPTATRAS